MITTKGLRKRPSDGGHDIIGTDHQALVCTCQCTEEVSSKTEAMTLMMSEGREVE
jgi:hypothetical protein